MGPLALFSEKRPERFEEQKFAMEKKWKKVITTRSEVDVLNFIRKTSISADGLTVKLLNLFIKL